MLPQSPPSILFSGPREPYRRDIPGSQEFVEMAPAAPKLKPVCVRARHGVQSTPSNSMQSRPDVRVTTERGNSSKKNATFVQNPDRRNDQSS